MRQNRSYRRCLPRTSYKQEIYKSESIKRFIEDQALLRSSLSESSCVSAVELTETRRGGGGGGAKSFDGEKVWSSMYHPILSA
jgi:hypothetical protein